jgi:ferritin
VAFRSAAENDQLSKNFRYVLEADKRLALRDSTGPRHDFAMLLDPRLDQVLENMQ